MNYLIAETMRRLLAPQHELSCSRLLWRRLMNDLRVHGRHGSRESGAFLLGNRHRGRARIVDFVLYDELDPRCLESGIVHFDGHHFGALWNLCKQRGLMVVADVHTHPNGAQQSSSDQAHPMITRPGHLALIIPRFAASPVRLTDVGIYCYLGNKRWHTVPSNERHAFFYIGIW